MAAAQYGFLKCQNGVTVENCLAGSDTLQIYETFLYHWKLESLENHIIIGLF